MKIGDSGRQKDIIPIAIKCYNYDRINKNGLFIILTKNLTMVKVYVGLP
jgi:hypothetical protein